MNKDISQILYNVVLFTGVKVLRLYIFCLISIVAILQRQIFILYSIAIYLKLIPILMKLFQHKYT